MVLYIPWLVTASLTMDAVDSTQCGEKNQYVL